MTRRAVFHDTGVYDDGAGTLDLPADSGLTAHLADTADAHDASAISFSPTGTIASTDVQAAIAEVASEATGATFGTPAVVLGTAAAAGSIDEVIRRDSTIVAFDATNPSTQAFGDAAAVGAAAFAARRDHKHAMPADPFNGAAAGGDLNGTYPNPLVDVAILGGAAWTVVTKAGDESNASNTVLQADDELFFTPASGGIYEIELDIIYVSTAGAGTPDIKLAFAEDATSRGVFFVTSWTAADSVQNVVLAAGTGSAVAAGTAATNRAAFMKGTYVGTGAQAGFYWAQNTSGLNATVVKAGSLLRYRRIL